MASRRIVHEFRNDERVDPIFAIFIHRTEIIIPGVHPTRSGSKHHTRRFRQFVRDLQARLRHGLTAGHERQLCHTIIQRQFLPIKIYLGIKIFDLRTNLNR